jgi:hypothetical protein
MSNTSGDENVVRIHSLLDKAKSAHGVYEAEELGGVYDEAWAQWYADYMMQNGMAEVAGAGSLDAMRLAELLSRADVEQRANEPGENWKPFYARYLAEALARNEEETR